MEAAAAARGLGGRSAFPGSRVMCCDDMFHTFPGNMRIDFCCGNAGVSQHFLNGSKVCAVGDEMGCEAVAEHMRVHMFWSAGSDGIFLDQPPDGNPRYGFSEAIEKDGIRTNGVAG